MGRSGKAKFKTFGSVPNQIEFLTELKVFLTIAWFDLHLHARTIRIKTARKVLDARAPPNNIMFLAAEPTISFIAFSCEIVFLN